MPPPKVVSAKSIFLAAIEIADAGERLRYVDEACRARPELRAEVVQLLAVRETAETGLLSRVVRQLNPRADESPGDDDRASSSVTGAQENGAQPILGRYHVQEEIGRGGMGTVYRAKQLEPIQRVVALKVINPGMDSREVIARFEAERQALAMMEHPNIARVLDAGMTPQDRPYFVMEFVDGTPITEYCAARELGLPERLGLFVDVCRAVQHAHQKGIIHRDLKPSNVLVMQLEEKPLVKVIDFGVAKALSQHGSGTTGLTQFTQLIGTPLYMSPEQADLSVGDIDTRSDVYSLGVLLYELLTGTTPLDREALASGGFERARRLICEVDPPRPSDRLSTLQGARDSTIRGLWPLRNDMASSLRGDLDWIVMKALEKDRNRRYDSPLALAQDIERHLQHEPIEARPPSLINVFSKWTRRHVALMWSMLLTLVALSIALGVSTVAITASRDAVEEQRQEAEQERQVAIDQRNAARANLYLAEMVIGQSHIEQDNLGGLYRDLLHYLPIAGEADLRDWEWHYLLSKCRTDVRTIATLRGTQFVAWSPDGALIGTPGRIWDAGSGRCLHWFDLWPITKHSCAWSHDSSKFAWCLASSVSRLMVWNRASNQITQLAHADSVWDVTWSPDGSKLVTASIDCKLRLWDVAAQRVEWTTTTYHHAVSVAWHPNRDLLAVACWDNGGIQVWDLCERKVIHELSTEGLYADVCWSPDGKQLAVCSARGWSLLDAEDWSVDHTADAIGTGRAIQYSPDGSLFAVAHAEKISIYDAMDKHLVAQLSGHRQPVRAISWAPDSRRLASSAVEVKSWNLDDLEGDVALRIEEPPNSMSWLDDNKTLVMLDRELSTLQYVDTGSAERRRTRLPDCGPGVDLSADRTRVAAYRVQAACIEIVDVETAQVVGSIPVDTNRELISFTLSDDGSRVVVQSAFDETLTLEVWNVSDERLLSTCQLVRARVTEGISQEGKKKCFWRVFWNPQGTRFATVGWGNPRGDFWTDHLYIFDAARGKRLHMRRASGRTPISHAKWNHDGQAVVLGTVNGLMEVIDARTGALRFSTKVHPVSITRCSWAPGSRRIAIGGEDGTVKIVSAQRGKVLLSFAPFEGEVTSLAWSPDGTRLAAAGPAGEIRIWDASEGYELACNNSRAGELAWAYREQAGRAADNQRPKYLRACLRHAPDELGFWLLRGDAQAQLGRFDAAVEEFDKAVGTKTRHSFVAAWSKALSLLGAGRLGEYREWCAELVDAFADDAVKSNPAYVAWLVVLAENPRVEPSFAVGSVARASSEDDPHPTYQLFLAAARFREGKFDEANTLLRQAATRFKSYSDDASRQGLIRTKYFQAMTRQAMGQDAQARRLLQEGNQLAEAFLTSAPNPDWQNAVIIKALRAEATARVGKGE